MAQTPLNPARIQVQNHAIFPSFVLVENVGIIIVRRPRTAIAELEMSWKKSASLAVPISFVAETKLRAAGMQERREMAGTRKVRVVWTQVGANASTTFFGSLSLNSGPGSGGCLSEILEIFVNEEKKVLTYHHVSPVYINVSSGFPTSFPTAYVS